MSKKANTVETMLLFVMFLSFFTIPSVACTSETIPNILSVGIPSVFTLYGEVDNIWYANVIKDKSYEIIIKRQNSSYPIGQIGVAITNNGVEIINSVKMNDSSVDLTFTSNISGEIKIAVYSKIAERSADTGIFSIVLLATT